MLIAMELPEVEVYADVAARIEQVWDLVSDIRLMPALSTELQSVQWADGFDEPCLGAQFLGTNRHAAIGVWTTCSHITESIRHGPSSRPSATPTDPPPSGGST